jgi:outer membrane protein
MNMALLRSLAQSSILTVLLASALPLHAQQATQDLLQVWEKAKQRDPVLASNQATRLAEQERIPQAQANLLPYIDAAVGGEHDDLRRLRGLDESRSAQRATWSLSLIQPIIDIGAWRVLERSRFEASYADVALAQAGQNAILRVSQAYFNVLAAQDALRTLAAQRSAIETQLQAAQQGFELGSATIADTYEAQARLDLIKASQIQAENALQISEDLLAQIINERPGELAQLVDTVSLPAPQPSRQTDWTDQATQANLTVLQADLAARIAEKRIDIARSEHYPTVQLRAQTGSGSDRYLYQEQQRGPRPLNSSVSVNLSIPLFAGGGISSVVREQTSRLQAARYDLEAAKRQAVQSTLEYFSGVTSGLSRIQALEDAERSSQASLEANQLGYEVGVRVNIDVLNAQQQLYETQRNLARARYDTLMHGLRLKASTGTLNEQDLIAVNQLLTPAPAAPSPVTP